MRREACPDRSIPTLVLALACLAAPRALGAQDRRSLRDAAPVVTCFKVCGGDATWGSCPEETTSSTVFLLAYWTGEATHYRFSQRADFADFNGAWRSLPGYSNAPPPADVGCRTPPEHTGLARSAVIDITPPKGGTRTKPVHFQVRNGRRASAVRSASVGVAVKGRPRPPAPSPRPERPDGGGR